MPLYEYLCEECQTVTEWLVGVGSGSEDPVCGECGSAAMRRMLSTFAAHNGSQSAPDSSAPCCGMDSPCDDPKRCCQMTSV